MGCLIEPPQHVNQASANDEAAMHQQEPGRKFLET